MNTDYLDEDGYPTDEALEMIRTWNHDNKFRDLMDFVKNIWWKPEWGWYETVDEKGHSVYNISTGGWSGNESIIDALQDNYIFWGFCWEQSRRGGHYIFKIKKNGEI